MAFGDRLCGQWIPVWLGSSLDYKWGSWVSCSECLLRADGFHRELVLGGGACC